MAKAYSKTMLAFGDVHIPHHNPRALEVFLHLRGGEFIAGEVEQLMDHDSLVRSACREIVECTQDRRSVLKRGDRVGLNWRIPIVKGKRSIRHVVFDANWWKSFVHARLAGPWTSGSSARTASITTGSTVWWALRLPHRSKEQRCSGWTAGCQPHDSAWSYRNSRGTDAKWPI